jgi:hypothetical protein
MFEKIDNSSVKSDKGFILERINRYQYQYKEEKKIIKIGLEPCRDNKNQYYEEIGISYIRSWGSASEANLK